MVYRTKVLPNGRIDADALPALPPGTLVEVKIPEGMASLDAALAELAQMGKRIQTPFAGTYTRDVIYGDHD